MISRLGRRTQPGWAPSNARFVVAMMPTIANRWMRHLIAAFRNRNPCASLIVILCLAACGFPDAREHASPAPAPELVQGVLFMSAYGEASNGVGDAPRMRHTATFVRGHQSATLEDNDIRGFLDGGFVHGWNQAGQTHIRLGRGAWTADFGENEILRGLQRWDVLDLPPGVLVESAALRMAVEKGPAQGLDVLLYSVSSDWKPGSGGSLRNNTSKPAPGEVWWRDVGFGEKSWRLPGAGFASATDSRADTGAMPLARARYEPGEPHLLFESARLTSYVQRRTRSREPLLLLLKLSDPLEDTTGLVLFVYSADYGEKKAPERRPQLRVSWTSPAELAGRREAVIVEPGRSVVFPLLEAPGASHFAVSFERGEGSERPWIEVRGGSGGMEESWQAFTGAFRTDWDWLEVRVLAARNPVAFGTAFETEIRDTWIRTKAPEEQRVPFRFVAPSGTLHRVDATYLGDFRWAVAFEPPELGRWRYSWSHDFVPVAHRGPDAVFDVVAFDLEPVLLALQALRAEIESSAPATAKARVARFERSFHPLERAAIRLVGPEGFTSERGRSVRALVGEIRSALGSRPLPEEPSEWARPWRH
ncbi:MAG: hypothetical protein JRH01_03215 [Deltaproteobacteria bacterium]|nr:hypothetical protein [Deltaproteobacteria bacterium]MBW2395965.1 hypothetical protein [Deltaproteobacteria bacterium]